MTRLSYTLPLVVGALALTACPGDDTSGTGTEGTGDSTGGDDGNTTPPTTGATMTTMPGDASATGDDTTTDPTGVDSTDDGGGCDPPCLPGQECIAGNCFGEPETTGPLCEVWGATGNYNDCVTMPGSCDGGACISDNPPAPTAGACAVLGCTDVCDCPDPGDMEGTLVCDVLTGDGQNGCFFDCSGGADCPEGMSCLGGFFCAYGGSGGVEPWGDCVNVPAGTTCEEGVCAVDDTMNPTAGACASPCMMASDCPEPPEGGAAPACGNFGGGNMFCILPCTGGCPDGMECLGNTLCVWPLAEAAGFGDCVDPPPSDQCLDDEVCFTDDMGNPTHGFCSEPCAAVADCPEAPATGDAPIVCGDLGGGDTCYLDCSGGETCPDGMTCQGDSYCAFEATPTILSEDFEGGMIPNDWTLIDNDGLTPANETNFVTDAFVVAPDPEGSQAAAATSWYNPAGTADDWLITPQVSPSATSMFVFQARSIEPQAMFQEDFEVLVSTTGTAVADFTDTLLTIDTAPNTYTTHMVDLSAYDGMDIYVAIRLTTFDGAILFVDNVYITQ